MIDKGKPIKVTPTYRHLSPNAHIIGNKVQVTKATVKFKLYDMKYNILNVNNNENILFPQMNNIFFLFFPSNAQIPL